jgi:hypothetical protein
MSAFPHLRLFDRSRCKDTNPEHIWGSGLLFTRAHKVDSYKRDIFSGRVHTRQVTLTASASDDNGDWQG